MSGLWLFMEADKPSLVEPFYHGIVINKLNPTNMKQFFLIATIVLAVLTLTAQNYPNRYVAFFSDKNNSPWSVTNPSEFLSNRALERRERYGIAVDQYDLPVNPSYVAGVAASGAQVINTSRWFNSVTFAAADTSVVLAVESLSFVDSVWVVATASNSGKKPEVSGTQALESIPPYTLQQPSAITTSHRAVTTGALDYGLAENQTTMVNLPPLHNLGHQGQGMLIAVLDAGFANANNIAAFDSLWINNRIVGWRDLSQPGNDVFAITMNSHGTSVLSVMGANLPGQIVGTAPAASYFLIRTEEAATEMLVEEFNWAAGAELADSLGADIINSSLGYTTFDNPVFDHSYADLNGETTPISKAAQKATTRGMVVMNSAGNSGSGSWLYIGAPADAPNVMTVGAVDAAGQYATFSSIGPSADGRIKPDITAQGQATILVNAGGMVSAGSGTSFSSPLMAGAMACLWQAARNRSPSEVTDAVKFSASKAFNPDFYYGYGIPNMQEALLQMSTDSESIEPTPEITLHQNPVSHMLVITPSASVHEINGYTLFNSFGSLVQKNNNTLSLTGGTVELTNVSQLNAGVYLLHLSTNVGVKTLKFIKI